MFEFVLKILDKSAADEVDIGVALDKCIAEDNDSQADLEFAFNFIRMYYESITKCRRMRDNSTIYTMCWLYEDGFFEAFDELRNAIAERNE